MRCGIRALAALFVLVFAFPASAQQWPSRPVRVVVPFSLGGATDLVARILGPALAESLGQPFVIENRPGASGNIGVELAAKAPPDGYTLLVGNISTNAINPSGFAGRLKFDPVKDLAPVTLVASVPTLLVTSPKLPPNSVKELIEYARARPGELNYSNPLGSYSHLDTLDLAAKQGIKVVLIPSKGAGSAITSIINGEVHFSFLTMSSVIPHVKAGRMKALATTSRERLPELPDVPTMKESGVKGLEDFTFATWTGLYGPARLPPDVLAKLNSAMVKVLADPAVIKRFADLTAEARSSTPQELAAMLAKEEATIVPLIKKLGIKPE